MTHYAVIWSFGEYYERLKPDAVHLTLVVIGGVLLLTEFAYLVMIFATFQFRDFHAPGWSFLILVANDKRLYRPLLAENRSTCEGVTHLRK